MSSFSYLGSKLALICMIFVGSLTSICMALASSAALKAPDVGGMAKLSGIKGTRRLSSLSSVVVTIVVCNTPGVTVAAVVHLQ
jgi:hypothetical protein